LGPQFYEPTVLTEVPRNARIWAAETFGPVAAIVQFDSDEEALEIANDSSVGLASYICTRDISRAFSFAKGLEAGLVGVNEGIMSTAVAPFGGVKESGLGREGSTLGIQEYLETKYVFMNY
jgi:succinate-semialdehyde dehydrogenase/glutarate-semialdehyde dehydrogenase